MTGFAPPVEAGRPTVVRRGWGPAGRAHDSIPTAEALEPRRLMCAAVSQASRGGHLFDQAVAAAAESVTEPVRPAALNTGISGVVYYDADDNGRRGDDEPPMAGQTVFLDDDRDRRRDPTEQFRVTAADGTYVFDDLVPGTYFVAQEPSAGYTQVAPLAQVAPPGGRLPSEGFDIELDFNDARHLTAEQRLTFELAAARWEQIITGDLPDAPGTSGIDDIRVIVRTPSIDGATGTLAQAAPTALRDGSSLPYRGFIEADREDLSRLQSSGQLYDVIVHEFGHVLGVGTVWQAQDLLQGRGTSNPRFTGPAASREFALAFSTSAALGVPLETAGGPATRDSHWRDGSMPNELMTGFVGEGANPLSRITAASMADIGYTVDVTAADDYGPDIPAAATIGGGYKVTLDSEEFRDDLDFGNDGPPVPIIEPPASVSGVVFDDTSGEGLRGAGDAGLADWQVYLDTNRNGRLDRSEPTTATGADGRYVFEGLTGGESYTVRALGRTGFVRTGPRGLVHDVTAAAGEDAAGNDFGFARAGSLSGRVFNDLDANGLRNTSETGLADVQVFLDLDDDATFDLGEKTTQTDPTGGYTFSNLRPGTYAVRQLTPPGYRPGNPDSASHRLTLSSGSNRTGLDFADEAVLA